MGDVLGGLAKGAGSLLVGGVGRVAVTAAGGDGGLNPVESVADSAASAVAEEVNNQAEEFLWSLAQSAVDGTQYMFHVVVSLLTQMVEPQVSGEFIYTMGGRIFFISLPLIVAFAALRIISASVRAQALTGARDAFIGAGISVAGTVALVPLTTLAVRAVDAAADGLLTATLQDGDEFVDGVMEAIVRVGTMVGNFVADPEFAGPIEPWQVPASGVIATSLICIGAVVLLMISCVVIGLALVARNMLLYIVIVVGPLCLSGLAWEPTRRWASIWMGWMVALIFTKLAIVVVMGLGVLAVTATIESGDLATSPLPSVVTVLSGILMLVLAAFMPVACFALFGWMGEAGVRELQGAADGAQGALASVPAQSLAAGQSATGRLGSLLDGMGSRSSGGDPGMAGGEAAQEAGGAAEAGMAGAEAGSSGGAAASTGAAAGASVATAGVALAAVAAQKAAEGGKEVADGVKDHIGGAVSETTGAQDAGGSSQGTGSAVGGGETSGAEQGSSSPGGGVPLSEGAGQSSNPWVQDAPPAPEGGQEPAAAPAAQVPMPEPGPVESEPAPAPAGDTPAAPVSAPLQVPAQDEPTEGRQE